MPKILRTFDEMMVVLNTHHRSYKVGYPNSVISLTQASISTSVSILMFFSIREVFPAETS